MATMINLSCFNCGVSFQKTLGQHNLSIKRGDKRCFCSPQCVSSFLHKNGSFEISCSECSKIFRRSKSAARSENLFCSQKCSAIYLNKNKIKKPRKKCSCGKEIERKSSYCRSCSNVLSRTVDKKSKGELSSNSKYWVQWRSRIAKNAREVYKRNNGPVECFVCKYNRCVDICHIKDVASFPDDSLVTEINDIKNLVALCKNHHWEFDHGFLSLKEMSIPPLPSPTSSYSLP